MILRTFRFKLPQDKLQLTQGPTLPKGESVHSEVDCIRGIYSWKDCFCRQRKNLQI